MDPAVEIVRARATLLLSRLVDPARLAERAAAIMALRPEADDYPRLFSADVAEALRKGYEALWHAPPPLKLRPEQTILRVASASVAELRAGHGGARDFPGGWKEIIPHLTEGYVWSVWEVLAPGASAGMSFDGLVAIDERFAWFPKPWRHLPQRRPKVISHYAE